MDKADSPPRPSTSGSGDGPESDATSSDPGSARPSGSSSGGSSTPSTSATKPGAKPAAKSAPTSTPTKPAAKPASKPAGQPAAASSAPVAKTATDTAAKTATDTAAARTGSGALPATNGSGSAPVAVAAATSAALAGHTAPQPVATVPVAEAPPRSAPPTPTRPVGPRRARLLVTRLDPWSVMKTAFMLSVSIAVVLLVATALLWWTLSVTGVFDSIGRTIDDVAGSASTAFDFLALVSFSRVMGVALVLAAVEIVLVSALTTLFAFLYNLSVGLTGGLEVTLSEDA